MPAATLFSGAFCNEEAVVKQLQGDTGFKLITDPDVIARASRTSHMPESKIARAFSAKTSVFNKFTHEKQLSIAHIKLAVAEMLVEDQQLISGFAGQLIPEDVSHVLRVCLIAEMKSRIQLAVRHHGVSEKEAVRLIHKHDEDCAVWVNLLFDKSDPWDPTLYDMLIPTDKEGVEQAAALIRRNLLTDVVKVTDASKQAVDDFRLAAQVEVALAREGHNVRVSAKSGTVAITITKHVLMLGRLEEELKSIGGRVPGVKQIETQVGKGFHQTDIYRKYDFNAPSKVLLVDDEREFVQTLSERLLMRDVGSAVAYDGESALEMVQHDEPEVMILDLKMPGIDGIEVLKRVKQTQPDIEVIILTGHGTEADREVCMKLGAFAYLQKPVDIDVLSETLRKANEKVRQGRQAKSQES